MRAGAGLTFVAAATAAAAVAIVVSHRTEAQQPTTALRQVAAIPLPGVSGRIDHLAFDAERQRLFVAALGNDTIEVIDTGRNSRIRSVTGFPEPQGLAVIADAGAVAVANGETGTLQLLDADTLATRWTVDIGGDADNVRYERASRRIWVAAEGGLYAVDPVTARKVGRVAIDGHPESFQLETDPRVFANLPGLLKAEVIAGDRMSMAETARWATLGCAGNYPMALDDSGSRLFIGCRRPARLAMLDTRSGALVASADVVGDTDDLFYDEARSRVYVIGGDGFVDVLSRDSDRLQRLGRVSTRPGARTGLWVGPHDRLYVAAPERGGQSAEILVLQAEPATR